MQDPVYIKFFFKSVSSDGQKVTIDDMRRLLRSFKLQENLAEDFIERTAGISKARSFNLEQLTEVLQGKKRPETLSEQKERENKRIDQMALIREALEEQYQDAREIEGGSR